LLSDKSNIDRSVNATLSPKQVDAFIISLCIIGLALMGFATGEVTRLGRYEMLIVTITFGTSFITIIVYTTIEHLRSIGKLE
jgi:hypothetical protein